MEAARHCEICLSDNMPAMEACAVTSSFRHRCESFLQAHPNPSKTTDVSAARQTQERLGTESDRRARLRAQDESGESERESEWGVRVRVGVEGGG